MSAALLTPAGEPVLEPLALNHRGQDLHLAATVPPGAQADEIELACVAHPGRAVQRSIGVIAPPQPHVQLARVDAAEIGGVEARKRAVARGERPGMLTAIGYSCHESTARCRGG